MKNPFKTGRLITDRLISKASALCLVCMVILLPLCCSYVSLLNGYHRQNALAELARKRGNKTLQKCDEGWGEVEALKENLKNALHVASRLECPEHDDLQPLWEECKRDVDSKRKDIRGQAQELVSSIKAAIETCRKAKYQVKGLKSLIMEDAKPAAEKIVAIDMGLRERLSSAAELLKAEMSRPLPVNTVGVGEYVKSCVGIVEIKGQERVRELESRCRDVDVVLADAAVNRGNAESLSHRLKDACAKIGNTLNEMKAQEEAGRKAYNAFLKLPLDSRRTIAQFRQKHLAPLAGQIDAMGKRLKSVIGTWTSGVCKESLEKIHLASNSINSASAFVEENRMELLQSTVESLNVPRLRLNDCIFALKKRIEDFDMDHKNATILKHLENVKNSCTALAEEFERIEDSGESADEVSSMLIEKVGKIKPAMQDISDEITRLEQGISDVRKGELQRLVSMTQDFKAVVARAAATLPRVEYASGFAATCIPFKSNQGVADSDVERMMEWGNGMVVASCRHAISFDMFNLENEAKNDFMAYRVFRFDFSIKGGEIGELQNIVLKLSKNGHTLRRGSNRGFPSKLKVNCSLKAKGIELSQGVSREKDGIDKNRSDSMRFLIPLEGSKQLMRYATFRLLVWISPYRETGWDYSGLSAEIYGVTTNGDRKNLSLSHEVSR